VVAAGKHVYLEKPVAVDVPGALKVVEIGKRAQGKLSLDVGFQIRDCPPFVELVRRIHGGALGKIFCGEAHYFSGYIDRPAWTGATPVERRLRNWVYDRVLSGDIIVEQNIHVVDICNWVLKAHPLKASGSGGRQGRPADGDAYGNYNVLFHYPEGVDITFSSTQIAKGRWEVTERFFGTRGTSQSPYTGPLGIWGLVLQFAGTDQLPLPLLVQVADRFNGAATTNCTSPAPVVTETLDPAATPEPVNVGDEL